jgi:hypothetical protein
LVEVTPGSPPASTKGGGRSTSKLGEDSAKAGEVLVTSALRAALAADPKLRFEPVGEVTGSKQNYRLLVS